ncbi:hypothetical protein Tco_1178389, partial [Tanacetum coccineum]
MEVHLDYLKNLKESIETLHKIVEEAKIERPLGNSLASACLYTKHSQELLEYDQCETSNSNTHKNVEQLNIQKTNVPVPPSTGVNSCTDASGSQPRSILKRHRIPPANSDNLKKVEDHLRMIKSSLKTMNRVDSSISSKRAQTLGQTSKWFKSALAVERTRGNLRLSGYSACGQDGDVQLPRAYVE